MISRIIADPTNGLLRTIVMRNCVISTRKRAKRSTYYKRIKWILPVRVKFFDLFSPKISHGAFFSVAICMYYGFWFSAFCVFPSAIHTLLLETLRRKITLKILHIFCMEVINLKENKEVCTSCFEVSIPIKKQKTFMESFYISFREQYLYLDSTILFWKKA